MKRFILTVFSLFAAAALLLFPEEVSAGALHGLAICKDSLLPSLFPFMIISAFMSYCGAAEAISLLFLPLTGLLSLPRAAGGVWLSAFIGGFPSGAHSICALYQTGALSRDDAERLLPCCVCSGPAFLMLAVGKMMLGSAAAGLALFAAQLLSVALLSALFCKSGGERGGKQAPARFLPAPAAFVSAVSQAAGSLISIFGFVVAFSVVTELIPAAAPMLEPLCPLLEVTLGCELLAKSKGAAALMAIAFITGFGGFSVCFQVLSLAQSSGLSPRRFWTVRALNGVFCAALCYLLLRLFPQARPVYLSAASQAPMAVWSVNSLLGGLCFAAMLLTAMQKLDIGKGRF